MTWGRSPRRKLPKQVWQEVGQWRYRQDASVMTRNFSLRHAQLLNEGLQGSGLSRKLCNLSSALFRSPASLREVLRGLLLALQKRRIWLRDRRGFLHYHWHLR